MRKIAFLLILMVSSIASFSQKELIKVTDLLKIKTINGISVSNDGKKVAYVVTSTIPDEKNNDEYNYQSQIWMASLDGNTLPRQLTFSKEGASQPAWSPDGNTLAFVRSVDGTAQLFLLPLNGGEPVQLTTGKGASGPVWSPDGKKIAFTSSFNLKDFVNDTIHNKTGGLPVYPLEKPGLDNHFLKKTTSKADADGTMEEVRAWLAKAEADKKAKVIHKLNFQQEATTSSESSISHVFIIEAVPGAKAIPVTTGFFSFSSPTFLNNEKLIVEANLDSLQMPDRSLTSAIYTINTNGGDGKPLVMQSDRRLSGATVSPSGKFLAYLNGRTAFNSFPVLHVLKLEPGAKPVAIPFDRSKSSMMFTADDKYLYFTTPSNGGTVINRVDLNTYKVSTLSSYNEGISSFDVKADKVVYVRTAIDAPFEVYQADLLMKNATAITSLNSSWIRDKKLSIPEKHKFKNNEGMEVEYWVMKPTNYEPGKKYPLLLEIHGGPSAMWGPGESSMWHEFQYFCSKGYGVVYSNPRGSGGYTEAFLRANINNWGAGPSSDVLTALEKTVAEGWADTSRLMVTGGSYAGYLVAWIIGHDKRFAAACAQRGVYDLRTFFGEGNAWRLVPNYFGGYPWEKTTYEILERESPINYVHNVTTPVIIFHGENDLRTGVISSEQYYKSLKVLGKTAEYVRHPGATHEITRSGNNRQRIDQMLRTWEFFERMLRK
ncbi:MAG: S9 family peptidase [Sphingobacteriales bacterium]